ncbi:MAG: tetratricopeptide repeat protein, partial [Planctomycetes bacterium]|nr:tetratricopeptide repeat protein [Planctomycetota bacterium]
MDDEPLTASDFFHRGVDLLRIGEFEAALENINSAISRNYYGAEIALVKGEILFELMRLDEALEWFNRASDLDPNLQAEALLWKGRIFFERKHFGRALSALNRVIELMPMPGEAYLNKGMVLCERGDHLKALESLEEARALIGDDDDKLADIHYWQGRAYNGLGRRDEAISALHRAIHLAPEFLDAYADLGEMYRIAGRLDQAREIYVQAIDEFGEDASLRNDYGNVLRDLGHLSESLEQLNQAISLDGEQSVAIFNRALTHERMNSWEAALLDYEAVLEHNPIDHEARLRRLDIFSRRDRFVEAQREYDALNEDLRERKDVQDTYARFLNRYARALESEGKIVKALAVYRRLLDIHPDLLDLDNPSKHFSSPEERQQNIEALLDHVPADDPNANLLPLLRMLLQARLERRDDFEDFMNAAWEGPFKELAYVCGGEMLYNGGGSIESALELCDKALEVRPDLIKALWLKVNILEEGLHRYHDAIEVYQAILKITPGNPAVLDEIGQLWLEIGEPYRALRAYREMQALMPVEPRIQSEIAQCYLQMGRTAEAIDELRRLLNAGDGGLRIGVDLVDAYLRSGNLTDAAELLADIEAENAGLNPSIEDACLELRASLLNAQRRHEQAEAAIRRVPREEWSPLGRYEMGLALARLGKLDEAQEILEPLAESDTPREEFANKALVELAKVRREQGKGEEAITLIKAALEANPYNTRNRTLLAWIVRLEGDAEAAEDCDIDVRFFKELALGRRLLLHEEFEDAADALRLLCQDWSERADAFFHYAAAQCCARQYKAS